jgi:phosphotransferase system  glucose/maltose/N-acetylglucosamine-specific IIC component
LKYLLISVAFFGIFALLAYALVYFRKKGGRTATLLNLMWMFMEWLKPHLLIGFAGLITIKLFENIQPLHIVSRHSDTLGWIGEFLESIFAIYFIGLLFTVGYGFIFTYWMFQKRSKEKGNDK